MLIVAIVATLAGAPAAFAQDTGNDPTAAQYTPPIPDPGGGGTAGAVAGGSDPAVEATAAGASENASGLNSTIGALPFTGLDLLILGGVALLLAGTGVALRRLSTPRGPTA